MITLKIKNIKLRNYFYWIYFIIYTLCLINNKFNVGRWMFLFIILCTTEMLIKNKRIINTKLDLLVLIYFIYNIASILWFYNGILPISVYITDLMYSVAPISFYFFKNQITQKLDFLKISIFALYYNLISGFLLYIYAPDFYAMYLMRFSFIKSIFHIREAFQGLCGVTATGTFAVITCLYSWNQIIVDKNKKFIIMFIVSLIAITLGERRSAIFSIIILIFFIQFIQFYYLKKLKHHHIIIEIIIIIIGIIMVLQMNIDFLRNIFLKVIDINSALDERSDNWLYNISIFKNYIFGNGIGSAGHTAITISGYGTPDSSYIKIFLELGIIGVIIFLNIVIRAIIKGFKEVKEKYLELSIVFLFLLQAIGSNVFEFQILAPMFWYMIGQCCKNEDINQKYEKRLIFKRG